MTIFFKLRHMCFGKRSSDFAGTQADRQSFGRDETGATAVEFAFVFPPFVALVFFVMQSALTYWTHHTLDFGVHETARLVRTGQITNQSLSKQKFKETICEYVAMSKADCMSKLAVELRPMPATPDYSPPMEGGQMDDRNAPYDSGASSTLMMLKAFLPADHINNLKRLMDRLPFSSSSSSTDVVLRSVTLFRNEPF